MYEETYRKLFDEVHASQRLQKEATQTQKSLATQNSPLQMAGQTSEDKAENVFYLVEGVKDGEGLILYPKSIT